jgi:hypothetical protein
VVLVVVAVLLLERLLEVLAHQVKAILVEARRLVYQVGGQQAAGVVQELLVYLVMMLVRLEYLVEVVWV